MRNVLILIGLGFILALPAGKAQVTEADTLTFSTKVPFTSFSDSLLRQLADSAAIPDLKPFKPDPNRAVLYALVPGLGQIYNRKYWKVPLVYGALMGCFYAVNWNNKNYQDYSAAYFHIISDHAALQQAQMDGKQYNGPWNPAWTVFVPKGEELSYVTNQRFQENLKRRKDYFRRYRDLSIIITVGVYALSIIDAYVDAQLFDFDISQDLSFHWSPKVAPATRHQAASYGVNCSLSF